MHKTKTKVHIIACFSVYCYFSQFSFVVIKISVLNYLLNYRLRLFLNKPCCKENDIHIALKNVYVEIKNTCSFLFSCFQRWSFINLKSYGDELNLNGERTLNDRFANRYNITRCEWTVNALWKKSTNCAKRRAQTVNNERTVSTR